MIDNFIKIPFIFILVSLNFLFADQYSWEKVLSEAKIKNPVLLKTKHILDQAELNYKNSWATFYPQINASAATTISGSDNLQDSQRYSYGISGRLSLFNGFADISQVKIKDLDLKIAKEQFQRSYSDITYNLKKSFINLLFAQETLVLSEKIYARRKNTYELIKLRYDAGREDKGSLLKVESDLLNAEFELKKAQRNKNLMARQLLKDIGIETFFNITVVGNFDIIQPQAFSDFTIFLNQIPEYKIAQMRLAKADHEIVYAKSVFYPDLTLSANISASGTEFPLDSRSWSSSLGLSVPLFAGGKNKTNLDLAKKNKLVLEQNLKEITLQLLVSLEQYYANLVDDYDYIKIREKYFQSSEEQVHITTLKYLNGLVSYYDWYSVENDYINSQKLLLTSKKNAAISDALWKNYLGIGE